MSDATVKSQQGKSPTGTSQKAFRLESAGDGIGVLVLDVPGVKVNKLSSAVLVELDAMLDRIAGDDSIRVVLLTSGKEGSGTFIAGADIDEIEAVTELKDAAEKVGRAHEVFGKLERLAKPVIAVIDGKCLGGGTELSLACRFRMASDHPHTAIGLPEVNLGIIPGFGGTQRLPRLIGVQQALGLILTGKTVDARKACKLGLVDRIAPVPLLRDSALRFAREVLTRDGRRDFVRAPRRGWVTRLMEEKEFGRRLIRWFAERDIARRTKGQYPAPLKALDAVLEGYDLSLEKGLEHERTLVAELVTSSISKNLISIFHASEKLRRGEGGAADDASGADAAPKRIDERHLVRRIGVVGAGVMGGGIAALLARKGFHVRLKDIVPASITTALREASKTFETLAGKRRMSRSDVDNAMAAISATTGTQGEPKGFRRCECVIEAIVEDMEKKQAVVSELEPLLPEGAVFATNTSSLSIDEIASVASRPERVAGLHFFNPVSRMPLVEIVVGERTSEHTVRALEALSREIGKYPLRVKNGPGFLVNRLLMPYLNEAAFLFEEGASMVAIDEAAVQFGLPMGPFALLDEVGLDVAGKVARYLEKTLGERARPAKLLTRLVEELGLVGKKGGAGFYKYRGGRRRGPNAAVLAVGGKSSIPDAPERWIRRMLLPLVNEAARCLDEGIVTEAWQVDIGMIMGTGFPPFRGGPLKWADTLGARRVCDALREFAAAAGDDGKARFLPHARLEAMAERGEGFYSAKPASGDEAPNDATSEGGSAEAAHEDAVAAEHATRDA